MAQYIGKTISLVSVTDNRYVGLLESIDSEKGVVTLNKVRCFGTEGRKQWGPQEIYPNPTVYETVTFNGNDVKDLSILDVGLDEVKPTLPPPQLAAQQQGQQVPPAMAGYGVYAPTGASPTVAQGMAPESAAIPAQSRGPTQAQARQHEQTVQQPSGTEKSDARVRDAIQGGKEKASRKPDARRSGHKMDIPREDFDFESNNKIFEKSDDQGPQAPVAIKNPADDDMFYNKKSSFFDTISTSTETNTNMRWQEEKQLNLDTFGQASIGNRRGRGAYRGRGRGYGRGGRGGAGGRGGFRRPDFNNQSNTGDASFKQDRVEF
ncbi:LAMI_0H04764g1_1 [Lachancea mirantina]|uniref:LAMI_0H04764g1_1 n=1 Tax=Lachancea mirantina TaxID=1230905 RepID=A0A1G4KEZ2_9SACH|nr:LAMI_0H04764g1_1 [Lachancea mirantina]